MIIKKNDMVSIAYNYHWYKNNGYSRCSATVRINKKYYRVPAAYIEGQADSKQAEYDCYKYLGLKPSKHRDPYATHSFKIDGNEKALNFRGLKPSPPNAANIKE